VASELFLGTHYPRPASPLLRLLPLLPPSTAQTHNTEVNFRVFLSFFLSSPLFFCILVPWTRARQLVSQRVYDTSEKIAIANLSRICKLIVFFLKKGFSQDVGLKRKDSVPQITKKKNTLFSPELEKYMIFRYVFIFYTCHDCHEYTYFPMLSNSVKLV